MTSRFLELYATGNFTDGIVDEAVWNRVFSDIDLRIAETEAQIPRVDRLILSTEALVLQRLNQTLGPAIAQIQLASELGFLLAASGTQAEILPGNIITFQLAEGAQRELFQPSNFVNLSRLSVPDDYAVARVLGFSRAQGELQVEVIQNWGDAGPHVDWQISASAGVVPAVVTMLEAIRTFSLATEQDREATGLDRIATRGHVEYLDQLRAAVFGRAKDAEAAAGRAKEEADRAGASADAVDAAAIAARFDAIEREIDTRLQNDFYGGAY